MILIGQFDSPFVRRVGIALRLYELPFEHRPWSTFSDAEKIRPHSPLLRVPVLILDDGTALTDSHIIIDYIDSLVSAGRRMFPAAEPERHRALRIAALACGLADKAVGLFYETKLHERVSQLWVDRCQAQIGGTLEVLDMERASLTTPYWFGERYGHADIVVATVLRHLNEAHPGLISMQTYPALASHSAKLEAMPVFQEISQPFIAPA